MGSPSAPPRFPPDPLAAPPMGLAAAPLRTRRGSALSPGWCTLQLHARAAAALAVAAALARCACCRRPLQRRPPPRS
eukprot:6885434-Alexandrium_andersonii.AAC.1